MPDSNPTLTASLMGERQSLMIERNDILRRMSELNSMLDRNSTQIEATDTLMLRFNPDHVAIDVRTDLEGSPLVVVPRTPLQLASSTSEAAIEQAAPTAAPEPEAPAQPTKKVSGKVKQPKKATSKKTSSKPRKASTEEEVAAVDAAVAAKPERSPVMQAMSDYFRKSNRNETILQILRGMQEPVSANTVAGHYRALYPLPDDSARMRAIHNSRISAALHYLKDRGQASRSAEEKGEGKIAENVRWELSKSYRSEMRKNKPGTGRKAKMNGHAPAPAQQAVDASQMSGTTH